MPFSSLARASSFSCPFLFLSLPLTNMLSIAQSLSLLLVPFVRHTLSLLLPHLVSCCSLSPLLSQSPSFSHFPSFSLLFLLPPLPLPSFCPSFDIPISPLCVSLYPPFTLSQTFSLSHSLSHMVFPFSFLHLSHAASDMSFVPLSHALPLLSAVTFFCTSLFPLLLHSVILLTPSGAFPSQTHFSTWMCALSLLLILSIPCCLPSLPIACCPFLSLSILFFSPCYPFLFISIICPLSSGMLFLPDVLVLPFPHRFLSQAFPLS